MGQCRQPWTINHSRDHNQGVVQATRVIRPPEKSARPPPGGLTPATSHKGCWSARPQQPDNSPCTTPGEQNVLPAALQNRPAALHCWWLLATAERMQSDLEPTCAFAYAANTEDSRCATREGFSTLVTGATYPPATTAETAFSRTNVPEQNQKDSQITISHWLMSDAMPVPPAEL